jgi:hypothetical protein
MKSPDRIFLMLAASDVEPSDIHQFFRWIERSGAGESTNLVVALRRHAKELPYLRQPKISRAEPTQRIESPRKLASNVQRRLVDLNLPASEVVELLQREYRALGVNPRDLPPFNKIALSVWLERLNRRFGPEMLMQAANNVLVNLSSKPQLDWPLKRDVT